MYNIVKHTLVFQNHARAAAACHAAALDTCNAHHRAAAGGAGTRRVPAALRGLQGKTLTTELTLLQGYGMNMFSKFILWHHLQLWNYMNHTDHRHIWRPVKTDLTILKRTDDKEAYKTPQLLACDQWGFITSDHMADVLKIRLTTLQLRVRPAELLLDGACEGQTTINSCQISLLNH